MAKLVFFALYFTLLFFQDGKPRRIQISGRAQGTTYAITYYAADSLVKKASIDSLLNRLDESLSIYKQGSTINRFNASEKGIEIDQHLEFVVKKALEITRVTDGLFDITVMPLTQAWGFGSKTHETPPSGEEIKKLLKCVGSGHLILTNGFLSKDLACTMIDVNGIAQGYSVDLLAELMQSYGLKDFIVELGGEIRVSGRKPGNEKMRIGIESPATDEMEAGIYKKILSLDSGAITTSGNYRRFYESGGKTITHLLDPVTGYSISNELIAATVFAKDAITADAYDNALMNMGLEKAMNFIREQEQVAAYFIYRDKEGMIKDTATAAFERMIVQSK